MPNRAHDSAAVRGRGCRWPPLRYPDLYHNLKYQLRKTCEQRGFETISEALDENWLRLARLRAYANLTSNAPLSRYRPRARKTGVEKALDLVSRTKSPKPFTPLPETLASPLYARQYRLRLFGQVWRLVDDGDYERVKLFTLVPQTPGWRIAGADLPGLRPKLLLERIRQQLVRVGLGRTRGCLIMFLHGEYDPTEDCYQLHVHGLATDGALAAIDRLKSLPCYKRKAKGCVHKPHQVNRMRDLARQGSYHLVQAIWPSKPTYIDKRGEKRRTGQRQRIPGLRFVEFLLWLDGLAFRDLVMLHGCRIIAGRLKTSSRGHRTSRLRA